MYRVWIINDGLGATKPHYVWAMADSPERAGLEYLKPYNKIVKVEYGFACNNPRKVTED